MIVNLKRSVKVIIRSIRDLISGERFANVAKENRYADLPCVASITQEFKANEGLQEKIYNLKRAAQQIEKFVVHPDEVFSFWKVIGNPNNGYLEGRNIRAGVVSLEQGGGLCQASGMIYHIAILTGIEIMERHNHSIDIYTDATRYTPLGTDATVVYGYKDLRLRNNWSHPFRFVFEINDHHITLKLFTDAQPQIRTLTFDIDEKGTTRECIVSSEGQVINHSIYQKQKT